jgi:hypothetical protein
MHQVNVSDFGKDHWSLLAYVETLCVDSGENGVGEIDKRRLRCNPKRHPVHAVNEARTGGWKDDYSTRLSGYFLPNGKNDKSRMVYSHDDWDCLDDLEGAGMLEVMSEVNGFVILSDRGREMVARIRAHKSKGGVFATFNPAATIAT